MQVEKTTGKTPPALKKYRETVLPKHFQYLANYFYDAYNGEHFSNTELKNWMELKGIELRAWELDCIKAMWIAKDMSDAKYVASLRAATEGKRG